MRISQSHILSISLRVGSFSRLEMLFGSHYIMYASIFKPWVMLNYSFCTCVSEIFILVWVNWTFNPLPYDQFPPRVYTGTTNQSHARINCLLFQCYTQSCFYSSSLRRLLLYLLIHNELDHNVRLFICNLYVQHFHVYSLLHLSFPPPPPPPKKIPTPPPPVNILWDQK